MKRVGSYEAKTHLPSLLAEVEAGETIMITRHGIDIAKLVPANDSSRQEIQAVIARIKEARKNAPTITVEELLEMRNEGRKPLE
jgi:prevent-host-death family protein